MTRTDDPACFESAKKPGQIVNMEVLTLMAQGNRRIGAGPGQLCFPGI